MTAATDPAEPADMAVMVPFSSVVPLDLPCLFLRSVRRSFRCSNMGNCMAVNGRFLATRAVYPLHSWVGFLNRFRATMVAFPSKAFVDAFEDFLTIWAFCLRTSAGVRIRQETSSPIDEAAEWMTGMGINGELLGPMAGLILWRIDLVPS